MSVLRVHRILLIILGMLAITVASARADLTAEQSAAKRATAIVALPEPATTTAVPPQQNLGTAAGYGTKHRLRVLHRCVGYVRD